MKKHFLIIQSSEKEKIKMITIEKLKAFGADTEDGLQRCMDDTDFYLMLVQSAVTDEQIIALEQQTAQKELDKAFETAHALKGIYANLSLTPLYDIVSGITESLRKKEDIDYSQKVSALKAKMAELIELDKQ